MLSLETTDTWTFSVDVTVGFSTNTFTNAATDASAYAAIVAFVAWCNDAGRPWSGVVVFSWSWARDTSTSGAKLTLSGSGTFTLSAGAATCLGLPSASSVASVTGTAPALGTWAPKSRIAVGRWCRHLDAKGDAAGAGAIRPGVPGLAGYSPTVQAVGLPVCAARLGSVLGDASHPRKAWVYQVHTSTWLRVALGKERRSNAGRTLYRFELEAAGTPM